MRSRARWRFASATLLVAVVWCWLLPWLSERPTVRERLRFLDERGIDPSAMYYTELDAMDDILDRIEGRAAQPPDEAAL